MPLDRDTRQIRLLRLHPPVDSFFDEAYDPGYDISGSDDICCTFSIASLNDLPQYEALSYVWGDTKEICYITLDGRPFPVTTNLHTALSQARHTTRILWVDALCINQEDLDERSNQVSLMHQIYSQASTVLISLGEAFDGSGAAISFIELVGSDKSLHFDTSLVAYGVTFESEHLQASLLNFFYLPWWTRIWTAQEWGLARRAVFLCGQNRLDGITLQNFARNSFAHDACCATNKRFGKCTTDGRSVHAGLQKAALVRARDVFNNWGYRGFIDVLATFQYRQCFDPLDKVFGLLGLAPESFRAKVCLDYNRSVEEVYTNVIVAAIAETRNLNVLSYIYGRRTGRLDLPSYVPDFTAAVHDKWVPNYLSRCLVTLDYYNASRGTEPDFKILDANTAATSALIFDTIQDTARGSFDDSWTQKLDEYRRLAGLSSSCSPPSCSTSQSFWQTLCGGIYYDFQGTSWFRPVKDSDYPSYLKWQAWINAGQPLEREEKDVLDFNRVFSTAVAGRKMVITSRGFLGLAPWRASVGDVLAIMPGGKVPYVLRPMVTRRDSGFDEGTPNRSQQYQFIGDAYVHGAMHGEVYDETRLEAITLV